MAHGGAIRDGLEGEQHRGIPFAFPCFEQGEARFKAQVMAGTSLPGAPEFWWTRVSPDQAVELPQQALLRGKVQRRSFSHFT